MPRGYRGCGLKAAGRLAGLIATALILFRYVTKLRVKPATDAPWPGRVFADREEICPDPQGVGSSAVAE
jgi:hypothetical protein